MPYWWYFLVYFSYSLPLLAIPTLSYLKKLGIVCQSFLTLYYVLLCHDLSYLYKVFSPLTAYIIQLLKLILLVIFAHIMPYCSLNCHTYSNSTLFCYTLIYFNILIPSAILHHAFAVVCHTFCLKLSYLLSYVSIPYYTYTFFITAYITAHHTSATHFYMLPYYAILCYTVSYHAILRQT